MGKDDYGLAATVVDESQTTPVRQAKPMTPDEQAARRIINEIRTNTLRHQVRETKAARNSASGEVGHYLHSELKRVFGLLASELDYPEI